MGWPELNAGYREGRGSPLRTILDTALYLLASIVGLQMLGQSGHIYKNIVVCFHHKLGLQQKIKQNM
jgi:hypothetical protein